MTTILTALRKPLQLPIVAVSLLVPCLLGNGTAHAVSNPTEIKPLEAGKRHWFQIGRASWYGKQFEGRATASGETFDPSLMTAAHRFLPLGSWVRVTNLRNKKSVVVKINDRGPVPQDRVLDLSQAAAKLLGFSGLASVRVELLNNVKGAMALTEQMQGKALLAQ